MAEQKIPAGYTLTGVRLSDPKNPEKGYVVTLEAKEAAPVVAAVRKAVEARGAGVKKRRA